MANIQVPVTKTEKEVIEKRARDFGFRSVSEFVRFIILNLRKGKYVKE